MPVSIKQIGRLVPIIENGLLSFLPSLTSLWISYRVIQEAGNSVWGELVEYQLFFFFAIQIMQFGNKDFVLREWSLSPQHHLKIWQEFFCIRSLYLLIPMEILCFFLFEPSIALQLSLWILLRFISQSFESVFTYERKYKWAIFIEAFVFLLVLYLLAFFKLSFTVTNLLYLFTLIQTIRCVLILLANVNYLKGISFAFYSVKKFIPAIPFLLLSLSGFLQLKIDLYSMSFFSDKASIGEYQVYASYVAICLMIPGFLISPFMKNIYRFNTNSKKKIQWYLIIVGTLICLVGIVLIKWILDYFYDITFDWMMYALAFIYIISPYFFMLPIIDLYKAHLQKYVLGVSFISIVLTLILNVFLITHFSSTGAMFTNVLAQLFMFGCYTWKAKKLGFN